MRTTIVFGDNLDHAARSGEHHRLQSIGLSEVEKNVLFTACGLISFAFLLTVVGLSSHSAKLTRGKVTAAQVYEHCMASTIGSGGSATRLANTRLACEALRDECLRNVDGDRCQRDFERLVPPPPRRTCRRG